MNISYSSRYCLYKSISCVVHKLATYAIEIISCFNFQNLFNPIFFEKGKLLALLIIIFVLSKLELKYLRPFNHDIHNQFSSYNMHSRGLCIAQFLYQQQFLYEQRDCALRSSFMNKGIVHCTVPLWTKGLCIAQFLYQQRDCACTVPLSTKGLCIAQFLYQQRDCAFMNKGIVQCTVPLWAKGLCIAQFLYEQRDCA